VSRRIVHVHASRTGRIANATFGDYLVFRGGLKNVLAEGRFDRDWKMPKDAAERLRSSGVVTVR
jgi:hypothetical protein